MTGARVRAEHGALSSAPRTTEDDVVMHTCSLSTQEGEAGGPVILAYRLSTTRKGLPHCADVIDLDCSGVTPLSNPTGCSHPGFTDFTGFYSILCECLS